MKPIYEELKKFAESELYPFCMPGHKKGLGIDFRMNNPFEMDITEIDNLDNLHHPTGIIKKYLKNWLPKLLVQIIAIIWLTVQQVDLKLLFTKCLWR